MIVWTYLNPWQNNHNDVPSKFQIIVGRKHGLDERFCKLCHRQILWHYSGYGRMNYFNPTTVVIVQPHTPLLKLSPKHQRHFGERPTKKNPRTIQQHPQIITRESFQSKQETKPKLYTIQQLLTWGATFYHQMWLAFTTWRCWNAVQLSTLTLVYF